MKNYKYIGLFLLSLSIISCDVNNELDAIPAEEVAQVTLNTNDLDFSKYIAIGASFTAGYSDGAMFKAAQENSFPNILAGKFGTEFNQPLMSDNVGGLLFAGNLIQEPRFYFDGAGPVRLEATPTTEGTTVLSGPFNNFGAPGAKSFHMVAPGYGNLAGVPLGLANPYFARMASSAGATVLGDALAQSPTFFTLSEMGGNDVLGYALSGGSGVDQTGNFDPATYGSSDITDPNVFASVFSGMVTALTANGAKGVIGTVPYITSLAHFTTVPYNPIPLDATSAAALNQGYAAYNGGLQAAAGALAGTGLFTEEEVAKRTISFHEGEGNAMVVIDEDLTDLGAINPAFAGIPKYRQATADDLFVLPLSSLIPQGYGTQIPLEDKWTLTPEEQGSIKTATDAYNVTITAIANANPNVALADFKGVLAQASLGIVFDDYTLNTSLVTGGLISLDGIHLTARGNALMANTFLAAIDAKFGSNFTTATNGLAKADDYPTNYSPTMQ